VRQGRCLGLAFIRDKKESILNIAVWKQSDGRSYQTFKHRKTFADPSLSADDIPREARVGETSIDSNLSSSRRGGLLLEADVADISLKIEVLFLEVKQRRYTATEISWR